MEAGARFTLCTRGMPAALAAFHLHAGDAASLDRTLEMLGLGAVREGSIALRDLLGVDLGVVMRAGPRSAILVPHGGVQVVRSLRGALVDAGLVEEDWRAGDAGTVRWDRARDLYPEARDEVEARALLALARCASPLGVEVLLAQRERWARAGGLGRADPAHGRVLRRLLDAPIVAGVGRANIGKSTLLNALAREHVALTGDEAGTTRDHVGVALELDGLVVRYLDLPGLREGAGEIERRAIEIGLEAVGRADLVLLFGDATARPVEVVGGADRVVVALRSDLGDGGFACDIRVCARTGEGIDDLARLIRQRLVPDGAIEDPTAWAFWDASG